MMNLRLLILSFTLILLLISCSKKISDFDVNQSATLFKYGIASGDPTYTSIILWTGIAENEKNLADEMKWKISRSADMNSIVQSGTATLTNQSASTFKAKVTALEPGTSYYYQFSTKKYKSKVGTTSTMSNNADQVRIGVVSCSNYEAGYFNAYESLADKSLDFVMHLGDYIYEYGPDTYGDKTLSRKHLPAKEILTLDDYRQRYGQYRMDPDLQLAHQKHPFIMIWDDHEISNDAYQTGAQNHQDDEGDYMTRAAIAKQVYHEWMPTDVTANDPLYRQFSIGNLADVIMLDGRLEGRTQQLKTAGPELANQSMLGAKQLDWFKNQLRSSTAKWKLIGNQVIFSPLNMARVRDQQFNMDAWDGYAGERDDIISYIDDNEISNVVIVAGDTHMSWAFEVPYEASAYKDNYRPVAIEIGTPSITSSNLNERSPSEDVIMAEKMLQVSNPHLKYVDGRNHGYTILTLKQESATVEWYYVSNLKTKSYVERLGKQLNFTLDGGNQLHK